jgi:nicotinate phosphoribosyltransferase
MFGIGTNYTNDFKKASSGGKETSHALNVVIKLAEVGGKSCVKISDELTKNTGNKEEVRRVKQLYSLPV